MTYTVATLPVTRATFEEIRAKLENVGYQHAIEYQKGSAISVDMTHIAITPLIVDPSALTPPVEWDEFAMKVSMELSYTDLPPSRRSATIHVAMVDAMKFAVRYMEGGEDKMDSLTLDTAPIGTKAPSINGGHWIKVRHGWKWCTGSTFPRPGGDWSGTLIPPETSVSPERVDRFMHWLDAKRDANVSECFHDIVAIFQGGDIPNVPELNHSQLDLLDGVPEHLR